MWRSIVGRRISCNAVMFNSSVCFDQIPRRLISFVDFYNNFDFFYPSPHTHKVVYPFKGRCYDGFVLQFRSFEQAKALRQGFVSIRTNRYNRFSILLVCRTSVLTSFLILRIFCVLYSYVFDKKVIFPLFVKNKIVIFRYYSDLMNCNL